MLEELYQKLFEKNSIEGSDFVSIGIEGRGITLYNSIEKDDIEITDDSIDIKKDNLILSFSVDDDTVFSVDGTVEGTEYTIENKITGYTLVLTEI